MDVLMGDVGEYNFIVQEPIETKHECGICGQNHITTNCRIVHITCQVPDKFIPSKARLSLPEVFYVKTLVDQSFNVYSKEFIPKGTQFGPYQAKLLINMKPSIKFPLKIFTNDKEDFPEYFLDNSDEEECSWLYFISPASDLEEQNLICYQDQNEIYYTTIKDIVPEEPLKVWYSEHYATKMQKQVLKAIPDVTEENVEPADINVLVKTQQKIMERDVWNCKFCGKLERNITTFANHLLEHYKLQSRKTCEICKSPFATRALLKKHLKIVHPSQLISSTNKDVVVTTNKKSNEIRDVPVGGPLLNDVMSESMDNSNVMLQHTDLNNFDISNITMLDSENFNVDNLLNDNVKDLDHFNFEIKDTEDDIICDICLKSFVKLKSLIQHLEQHTGNLWCKKCNKVFCRKENLKVHSCNVVYKFACKECDKIFVQQKYLTQHMNVVHRRKFTCENCKEFFSSLDGLKVHACQKKEPKQKFHCTKCSKFFFKELYLRNHLKRHLGKSPPKKSYVCEICSKVLVSQTNLKLHLKTHKEPNLACDICDKKFHRPDVLNNHKKTHITGTCPQYRCPICDKTFKSKKLLWFHKKSHEEKSHKCSICPANFRLKKSLDKHMKIKHEDSKVEPQTNLEEYYECPLCDKKMKLKSSLSRHLKKIHANFNDDIFLMDINPKKSNREQNNGKKDNETDLNIFDLKETIDNMNFTTDISIGGNDETNMNMEFEDMLKSTTENIDFLNESNDGLVENLLNMPLEGPKENQSLSMPDLTNNGTDDRLGTDALILTDTNFVTSQDNTAGEVVFYILGEKLQM